MRQRGPPASMANEQACIGPFENLFETLCLVNQCWRDMFHVQQERAIALLLLGICRDMRDSRCLKHEFF